MEETIKHRLVGAAVLIILAVIFVPLILENEPGVEERITSTNIPPEPKQEFKSRIVPLSDVASSLPATPNAKPAKEVQSVPERKPEPVKEAPQSSHSKPTPTKSARSSGSASGGQGGAEKSRVGLAAWAVQLGSFSNAENALRLRDRLRDKGLTAFVESAYVDRKRISRVYVGPEISRDKAAKARDRLEREFKLKGLLVRYPGS